MRAAYWFVGITAVVLFVSFFVRFERPGENGDGSAPRDSGKLAEGQAPPSGAGAGPLAIPVTGVRAADLVDTFTQARESGLRSHDAIDILAPRGTPVVAAAPGRVEKLFDSERGGLTIYVRSPDRRWTYYYAHLDAYRSGLREGQTVRTGEMIATVGATGNADPAAPHLHFAVSRMGASDSWHQGTPVNPYPLLVRQ